MQITKEGCCKKDPSTYEPWEKALIEAFDNKNDWTDKKYIEPILKCLDNLN